MECEDVNSHVSDYLRDVASIKQLELIYYGADQHNCIHDVPARFEVGMFRLTQQTRQ